MNALELAYQEGVKLAMQEVGLLKQSDVYANAGALGAGLGAGIGALGGGLSDESTMTRGAMRGTGAGFGAAGGAGLGALLGLATKDPQLRGMLTAAGVLGGGIAGGVGGYHLMRSVHPNQNALSRLIEGQRQ